MGGSRVRGGGASAKTAYARAREHLGKFGAQSDASGHVGLFGKGFGSKHEAPPGLSSRVESLGPAMSQPEGPSPAQDVRAQNRARFELELEFVQSLANPYYLHSLAQQGILGQPAFVHFLRYLLYWKEKDYARFIL